MSLANLINELNPQQKQAATTEAQHSLVLAGAGCGKTKIALEWAKLKNAKKYFGFAHVYKCVRAFSKN